MAGDEGRRKIKLFCPSVSKIVDWVAWNDQKLDFRGIAAAFGLEPSTVKLNGHFISRGIDLVATCVTWQSLLAFFSSKGLPTGKHEADALLVQGKLCRVGTKSEFLSYLISRQKNNKTSNLNSFCNTWLMIDFPGAHSDHQEDLTCNDLSLIKPKKLKAKCSGMIILLHLIVLTFEYLVMTYDWLIWKFSFSSVGASLISGCNKRKLLSEDTHSLKKLKLNMDDSFGKIPV